MAKVTLFNLAIVVTIIIGPNKVGSDNVGVLPYRKGSSWTFSQSSPKEEDSIQYMRDSFNKLIDMLGSLNASVSQLGARMDKVEKVVNNPVVQRIDTLMASVGTRTEMLERSVYKPMLDEFIRDPKARFFQGTNFTGRLEEYRIDPTRWEGSCKNLEHLNKTVSSVITFGKCVRLFQEPFCDGWSLAVYPGSGNSHQVTGPQQLTSVSSVGPCLPGEFDHASFVDLGRQTIVKNKGFPKLHVPDLLKFPGTEDSTSTVVVSDEFTIRKYALGPRGRPEYILGLIKSKHLGISQPQASIGKSTYYNSLNPQLGDVIGHGIPVDLGGPANASYNIFPQTSTGAEQWRQLTSYIAGFLGKDETNFVYLSLNFFYGDTKETRPYAFTYNIFYNERKISYGRVQN